MKKLQMVGLAFFLSVSVFAQKNQGPSVFREVPVPSGQVLSSAQHLRMQKLGESKNYLRVSLIKLEGLEEALRGELVTFDLPGFSGKTIARTKRIDYSTETDFMWNGTFNQGEAIIIRENGRIFGQIRKNGAIFDIQYLENGYVALIEYNMEKLYQIGCAVADEHNRQSGSRSSVIDATKGSPTEMSHAGGPDPLIRALVLFTPAAEATGMDMTDLANTARGQWITAQLNSNVVSNLVIAGVEELNFIENDDPSSSTGDGFTDIDADVTLLRNNLAAQRLRNQFEADIVLLFTDGDYPGFAGNVADIGPIDDEAYAIVQVPNATATMTFIHEAAHLFGARHQFSADNTPGDAHGHNWETGWWIFKDEYRSIMRTFHADMERVLYFSNPGVTHEGEPTGVTGTSFNARVINVNGHIVEDFRFAQPDFTVSIFGPGSANEGDALYFTSSVSNGQAPYTYQWQANTGSGFYTVGAGSTLNFTMPADDLDIRLTVTDANTQQDTDFHSVMNLYLGGGGCTVCPDSTALDLSGSEKTLDEQVAGLEKAMLYPNPSSDRIQLAFKEGLSQFDYLQIVDSKGEVRNEIRLQPENRSTGQLTMDISGLKQGTYIIKLLGKDAVSSFRFIKE